MHENNAHEKNNKENEMFESTKMSFHSSVCHWNDHENTKACDRVICPSLTSRPMRRSLGPCALALVALRTAKADGPRGPASSFFFSLFASAVAPDLIPSYSSPSGALLLNWTLLLLLLAIVSRRAAEGFDSSAARAAAAAGALSSFCTEEVPRRRPNRDEYSASTYYQHHVCGTRR